MAKRQRSAGILPVREVGGRLEFFLVHPGGPFFAKRDTGAWSIAKGAIDEGEDPLAAAQRELVEETGFVLPPGPYVPLGQVKQKAGKLVDAWAVAADFDPARLVSNTFELEWPPRSGTLARFPEVDRAAWLDLESATEKILAAQQPFLDRALALRAEILGRP
jgi:predicted NUDIX family NTP pyrophosphohydrolase